VIAVNDGGPEVDIIIFFLSIPGKASSVIGRVIMYPHVIVENPGLVGHP